MNTFRSFSFAALAAFVLAAAMMTGCASIAPLTGFLVARLIHIAIHVIGMLLTFVATLELFSGPASFSTFEGLR